MSSAPSSSTASKSLRNRKTPKQPSQIYDATSSISTNSRKRKQIPLDGDDVAPEDTTTSAPEPTIFSAPPPTRSANGVLHFASHPTFCPNLTPAEIIELGSFGGGYYRPIYSSITKTNYKNDYLSDLPPAWLPANAPSLLTKSKYDKDLNRFKVSCGQDLDAWESQGWITKYDPRGWFQWYIRFYQGRRITSDGGAEDERQVSRWIKCADQKSGRWLRTYLGKVAVKERRKTVPEVEEEDVSPVIRQVLQHWALDVKQEHLNAFMKEKGIK